MNDKQEKIETIMINNVEYVKASDIKPAEKRDGMDFCVIRTYSAGVHVGYLKSRNGKEVELLDAIRIHYWDGAASLSQLARDGVSKPENCRFALPVQITLTEAIEIIPCTEKARVCIQGVKSWEN